MFSEPSIKEKRAPAFSDQWISKPRIESAQGCSLERGDIDLVEWTCRCKRVYSLPDAAAMFAVIIIWQVVIYTERPASDLGQMVLHNLRLTHDTAPRIPRRLEPSFESVLAILLPFYFQAPFGSDL
jgi:hypothetical protein